MEKSVLKDLDHLILESCVFIIDSISSAFITSIIANRKEIHCIYEIKQIKWRNVDFVKLYDFILSDVRFKSKTIYQVPHPFFMNADGLISNILEQIKFKRKIRKQIKYDKNKTYISCSTSSVLISIKDKVDHILLDEGMGSLVARHRPDKQGKNKIIDIIKEKLAVLILPFRFSKNTKQITLTNDSHKSIISNLDFRLFTSTDLEKSLDKLISHSKLSEENAIILIKAPSPNLKNHPNEGIDIGNEYLEFNLDLFNKFISHFQFSKETNFYLKLHPALGRNSEFLKKLIWRFSNLGYKAFNICDFIAFDEATSIPVEAILKYAHVKNLLAFDISSTLWNIAYLQAVKCYCPLDDIIKFSLIESPEHQRLHNMQRTIDNLLGNPVIFY